MIISELKIYQFRCFSSLDLKFNSHFNFIYGSNGCGKTSILEAMYLLSCGHSFRSRENVALVSNSFPFFTLFARTSTQDSISIRKSISNSTQIKINNQTCTTTSELAYYFPCQIVYADVFQIIDTGPAERRTILDWGLFHVKQPYLKLFKDYKKILKQRNILLRQKKPYSDFVPWDMQLAQIGEQIHILRENYFGDLKNEFQKVLNDICNLKCTITYFKGWDKKSQNRSLIDLLRQSYDSDCTKKFTQYGIHQADLIIESDNKKAKHYLSRGQQKIILISLKIAQINLLNKKAVLLIDDLPAELDLKNQYLILEYLARRGGQYIISSTNRLCFPEKHLSPERYRVFHLEDAQLLEK